MQELYQQNPAVAWRNIDGEAILVQPQDGMMLILNQVGTFIWQSCEKAATAAQVSGSVKESFDVSADVALRDTEAFLKLLLDKHYLMKVEVGT